MIGNMKLGIADFEPEGWLDYARIPFDLLRFCLFFLIWQFLVWKRQRGKTGANRLWAALWGRHDDPTPILCPRCLWGGRRKDMYHGYNEYEAEDECPRCGLDL